MQEFNFRLRQQCLLPFILPRQNLCGKQLRNPLPQRAVDGAEQSVFCLIEFDRAHHPLIFAAQWDHERRAEFALRMERTAIRHFVTVGIDHFPGFNGAQSIGRRDRFTRQVVIVPGAGKRQQPLTIRYRHRADIQFFIKYQRHFHAVLFVKALTQYPFRRCGNF